MKNIISTIAGCENGIDTSIDILSKRAQEYADISDLMDKSDEIDTQTMMKLKQVSIDAKHVSMSLKLLIEEKMKTIEDIEFIEMYMRKREMELVEMYIKLAKYGTCKLLSPELFGLSPETPTKLDELKTFKPCKTKYKNIDLVLASQMIDASTLG